MAEVLGKLDPDADASMLTKRENLTPLEDAQVTLAVVGRMHEILDEARQSDIKIALGHYLVALEDGRVVAANYYVSLGE